MLGLASNTAALRTVRVRSADRDVLAVRQRVERALAAVDWSPPGLPPGAILLVRRLVPAMGDGASVPWSFGERVSLALRERASHAHRPWLQADVLDAEAVVFVDEAELMACFVRDWLRGRVAERWWWKSVLADAIPQAWLRRTALERPEVLVPAISLLARGDEAAAFVARLDPRDCDRTFDAVAQSHAAARTVTVEESWGPGPPVPIGEDGQTETVPRSEITRSTPLRRLLKEAPELRLVQSKREHRRLLALVLALIRAPTWARTREFVAAIEALDRASVAELTRVALSPAHEWHIRPLPRIDPDLPATSIPQSTLDPDAVDATESPNAFASADLAPALSAVGSVETRGDTERDEAPVTAELGASESIARGDVRVDETQSSDASADVRPVHVEEEPVQDRPHDIAPTDPRPVATTSSPGTAPRIETRFGGLFYLLNAALAMELYSDFTAPCGRNLALSPWDWLAIVGDAWFGRELRDDPAWSLLAELAGREPGEDPGRDFEPPHARWWAEHIAALRERIALAVGAAENIDVPAFVCRHDGAIEITATTVHVYLRLVALDLSIRIAGLDRDPGWIPAAGRSVRFHFD